MMSNKKKAEILPLVKNNLLNNDEHIDWSDQELDELVGDPLEHVLEQMRRRPQNVSRLQCYRSMLFFSVLCFVMGAVISYLIFVLLWNPSKRTAIKETVITQKIIHYVDEERIKTFLRDLTRKPHLVGTSADKLTADYISTVWKEQGIDTHLVPYDVLLSYPNSASPNKVSIVLSNGTEIYSSRNLEKPLHFENSTNIYPPFAAYSPSTNVPLQNDPVYVNYGCLEDFLFLQRKQILKNGYIAVIRLGKISPALKVHYAEKFGAKGVILYPDPSDFIKNDFDNVYPASIYLPSSGIPRVTLNLENGDPFTPFYPATKNAYRIPENETKLPKIPVIPISYQDATHILRNMNGVEAPKKWKGNLSNVSYLLGPGYINTDMKLKMEVHNENEIKTIYNVIGIIQGSVEPDRFILLGSHRDSWTFGSVSSYSGTAAILEVSHVYGKLLKEGWKPRRSIIFCSWSSSMYGFIGSQEWLEDNQKHIAERAIAYLNVDMAVEGNATLSIQTTPLLYRLFSEAAKKIPNPDPKEIAERRLSVFETWFNHSHQKTFDSELPEFKSSNGNSDDSSFMFGFGIPSANIKYRCSTTYPICCPLCSTLYETYYLQSELIDKNFHYHRAITQLWAEVVYQLSDAPILYLDVEDYAAFLNHFSKSLKEQLEKLNAVNLDDLDSAISLFHEAATKFSQNKRKVNVENFLAVRSLNDKLTLVERIFIDKNKQPDNRYFRHVVLSPSSLGNDDNNYFSNIKDLIYQYKNSEETLRNEILQSIRQTFSATIFSIRSAAVVLQEDI